MNLLSKVEITDIPYFDKITVDDGHIGLICENEDPFYATPELVTELIEALRAAVQHATGVTPVPDKPLRTFREYDPEPDPEVRSVRDGDGDLWTRSDHGTWDSRDCARYDYVWTTVRNYAPLIEVRNA